MVVAVIRAILFYRVFERKGRRDCYAGRDGAFLKSFPVLKDEGGSEAAAGNAMSTTSVEVRTAFWADDGVKSASSACTPGKSIRIPL